MSATFRSADTEICDILEEDEKDIWLVRAVIKAGGEDILHRALKHECERSRVRDLRAFACLFSKIMIKVCKPGCIDTLVKLINTYQSRKVKKSAMLAFKNISFHNGDKWLDADGITTILNNLHEDFFTYMQSVAKHSITR